MAKKTEARTRAAKRYYARHRVRILKEKKQYHVKNRVRKNKKSAAYYAENK